MVICIRQTNEQEMEGRAMGLGARITKLRIHRGESLQEVADAVGVSKAHIWELEKGRTDNPSMGLVTRLADHFGISVSALVGEDPRAADADPRIARMFRQAKDLEPEDLEVLDDMMKSLLKRRGKAGSGCK
jgi:transcriptional regulator with XRE-family HTH domain